MRTISGAAQTVLDGPDVPMVMFVEMLLTAPLRFNTSPVNITWSGEEWLGAGALGSINEVQDAGGEPQSLQFTLSGISSGLIATALAEPIRNKGCKLWLGILSPTTMAVLDAPQVWAGTLDQMPISQSGQTCSISVTAEHAGVRAARPKPLRETDADHQLLYPGDTSRRFIVSQAQHKDVWPAATFYARK